ncbi:hypothetical protein A2U01_0063214, partial [Trifolium medium]|nr:hypothetical protein [Trifolium medium]
KLREGTIVAEELENDLAELNANIKAKDKAFNVRISKNVVKHLKPFFAEIQGVQKNVSGGEDAPEINAYEEAYVVSLARNFVKHVTPYVAEFFKEGMNVSDEDEEE